MCALSHVCPIETEGNFDVSNSGQNPPVSLPWDRQMRQTEVAGQGSAMVSLLNMTYIQSLKRLIKADKFNKKTYRQHAWTCVGG